MRRAGLGIVDVVLGALVLRRFDRMTLTELRKHAAARGITVGQLTRQIEAFSASSRTSAMLRPNSLHSSLK